MSALVPITRQEANRECRVEMLKWSRLQRSEHGNVRREMWAHLNISKHRNTCRDIIAMRCIFISESIICSFIGKLACLFSGKMMDLSEPDPLMMWCSSWNMKYCNVLMNFLLQIENFHRARMAPGEPGHVLISVHDHVYFTFVPSLYFIKMITFN